MIWSETKIIQPFILLHVGFFSLMKYLKMICHYILYYSMKYQWSILYPREMHKSIILHYALAVKFVNISTQFEIKKMFYFNISFFFWRLTYCLQLATRKIAFCFDFKEEVNRFFQEDVSSYSFCIIPRFFQNII